MTVVQQILLILVLILANGVFALSEIAVVSARKSRLERRAAEGDRRAARALELAAEPNRFLATVQVGITLVGIFAGAYGGATLAAELGAVLNRSPAVAPMGDELALVLVVLAITYLSLVVGELVPKRLALNAPERVASLVAGPMHALAVVAGPVVKLLGASTDGILRLLRAKPAEEAPVTEEEIAQLLEVGTEAGVFEEEEQELVERVFWLADQRVDGIMTPRRSIVYLDLEDEEEENRAKMVRHRHARFPVCRGGVDRVIGMVEVSDLWARSLAGEPLDLERSLRRPLFVPQTMRALRLLELFRETGIHFALVVDEYGSVEGLVTLKDLLEEIAGDLSAPAEPRVVERPDGSFLVDGSLSMDDFREALGLPERRAEERAEFRTVAGFVLSQLGRIPTAGEAFEADGLRVEVVDMDGYRVDKVLATPLTRPGAGEPAAR